MGEATDAIIVEELTPADIPAAEQVLDAVIAGRWQARLGELVDVLDREGVVARADGTIVGVATYAVDGTRAELAAIAVTDGFRQAGIGSRLVDGVLTAVGRRGAQDLWLVTTNDNLDALRFYQRRGFCIDAVNIGATDRAREIKPGIPEVGQYGIPMRDEFVLARRLTDA